VGRNFSLLEEFIQLKGYATGEKKCSDVLNDMRSSTLLKPSYLTLFDVAISVMSNETCKIKIRPTHREWRERSKFANIRVEVGGDDDDVDVIYALKVAMSLTQSVEKPLAASAPKLANVGSGNVVFSHSVARNIVEHIHLPKAKSTDYAPELATFNSFAALYQFSDVDWESIWAAIPKMNLTTHLHDFKIALGNGDGSSEFVNAIYNFAERNFNHEDEPDLLDPMSSHFVNNRATVDKMFSQEKKKMMLNEINVILRDYPLSFCKRSNIKQLDASIFSKIIIILEPMEGPHDITERHFPIKNAKLFRYSEWIT